MDEVKQTEVSVPAVQGRQVQAPMSVVPGAGANHAVHLPTGQMLVITVVLSGHKRRAK